MSRRTPQGVLRLAAILLLLLLAGPPPAAAFQTPEERLTDDTAFTLPRRTFRLSFARLDYSPLQDLQLATYHWPWLLRIANVSAKYELFHREHWSLAARVGLARLDSAKLKTESERATVFSVIPVELGLSGRCGPDLTLSLQTLFTKVQVTGTNPEESVQGAAAVTNLQLRAALQWRLGPVLALLLRGSYLAYQDTSAAADVTLELDDYTTAEVHGAVGSDVVDVQHAWSVALAGHWSWRTFNLVVGAGYGNYSVPVVNFVLPQAIPFPELDLFWVW